MSALKRFARAWLEEASFMADGSDALLAVLYASTIVTGLGVGALVVMAGIGIVSSWLALGWFWGAVLWGGIAAVIGVLAAGFYVVRGAVDMKKERVR